MTEPRIFNRYYKVVGGELGARLRAQLEQQRQYLELLNTYAHQLCATKVHTFTETGKFAGFEFPDHAIVDPTLFIERPTLVFTPKRRENRGFWRTIEAIGGSVPTDVLRHFGLSNKAWVGEQPCRLTGFYTVDVWFVIVPSRHFDAATLKIAADHPDNVTDPVRMLWEPPMDWVQLTEGAYLNEWHLLHEQEMQIAASPKK